MWWHDSADGDRCVVALSSSTCVEDLVLRSSTFSRRNGCLGKCWDMSLAHVTRNGLRCLFFLTQWSLAGVARCRELSLMSGLLFSMSVNRNRVLCMRLTIRMILLVFGV